MRIVLIGYGKMGSELEKAAKFQNHEIVHVINSSNLTNLNNLNSYRADVAIEFSNPASAVTNILKCFEANLPVVVGTTGWYDHIPQLKETCEQQGRALIYASNFSIGVNILFELNRKLASIMNLQPAYEVLIEEIHHTQKKDSPSGTALTIAKDILERIDRKKDWIEMDAEKVDKNHMHASDLKIYSNRLTDVVGTHVIKYVSESDQLELRHEAFSRAGFVQGALVAAAWISGKKGFYTMQDLLHTDSK